MTGGRYSFGPFTLDPGERRLLRDGEPVEVTARYFDALLLMVRECGRLVSKDRFHQEVWKGIPVTDEALTQCIRTLRRALGDDASAPQYIATVPRHGYRFIASVEGEGEAGQDASPSAALHPALRDGAFAALGGALAGAIGALGYLALGIVGPGAGAASTLLVLLSVNVLLGSLAGAAIGGAIALAASRGVSPVLAGGLAGALVGAIGHAVGASLFELVFGGAPRAFTGAAEGLLLGAAAGLGARWLGALPSRPAPVASLPGVVAGLAAGLAISLLGGRLMIGSLGALAERFPATRLHLAPLGQAGDAVATMVEAGLFVGGVTLALALARRAQA